MKKILGFICSITLIFTGIVSLPANASTLNESTKNKQELLHYLDKSEVKNFSNTPEGLKAYEKIKKNAIRVASNSSYIIKIDTQNKEKPKKYTEAQFKQHILKNSSFAALSSNSGNRYSWIKLTVEAYDFGNRNFMFCGFYKWLTQPYFTGSDVLTLGHDSSITFDTNSAFGYTQLLYNIAGQERSINNHFNFAESKKNTTSTNTGVGYKFRLMMPPTQRHGDYSGAIYCNGRLNNGNSGNIEVSYGHSEISIGGLNLNSDLSWKPSGAISFDIKGTQDVATHGDGVIL